MIPATAESNECVLQIEENMLNGKATLSGVFSIHGIDTTTLTPMTCDPNQVGTTTDTLANQFGCDSLVITNTILETEPPVATCKDTTLSLDVTGNATITAANMNNGSIDNCGIQSLSLSQTTFDCSDVGINSDTLTVTDVNGNTSTCTATVTVEDGTPPVATCQDITIVINGTCMASIGPAPN